MSKFDLVTHKRNSKGKIVAVDPYRLHIKGDKWMFERPPGSGNMYALNGELLQGPLLDEQKKAAEEAVVEKKAIEKMVEEVKKDIPMSNKEGAANGRVDKEVPSNKGLKKS